MHRNVNTWAALGLLLGLTQIACGGPIVGPGAFNWLDGSPERGGPGNRAIRLRWRQELTRHTEEAFVPVERAEAALDPANGRVYVGSTAGRLWALTATGREIYHYEAGGGIAARPALDEREDELYLPTEDGVLHRLRASSGELTWRSEVDGAVSRTPVLRPDAVYVVSDNDRITAVSREDGEALWQIVRDVAEGYYISGHAGLVEADNKLLTGLSSGVVLAIDPTDGAIVWERDMAENVDPGPDGRPRFPDADATPLVVDDTVYAASFAGGMMALELESGSVLWVDEEMTGVTNITQASNRLLIISSADDGLICFDRHRREVVWRRRPARGAPGEAVVLRDVVLYGETTGGFVTAALADGLELGRIESGHGFSAAASVALGRGFVLSNGGSLFAFALPGAR